MTLQFISEITIEITRFYLPKELNDYLLKIENQQIGTFQLFSLIICLVFTIYFFYVMHSMFKIKKNSRQHAIIMTTIGIFTSLLFEPTIKTGIDQVLNDVGVTLWGVVLGIMYFSDLKVHFETQKTV